jgi:hypothetical protein
VKKVKKEVLSAHVDRQKEINERAKEAVGKSLGALSLPMIIQERRTARKRFIATVVKNADQYFTASLRNGRELKNAKQA